MCTFSDASNLNLRQRRNEQRWCELQQRFTTTPLRSRRQGRHPPNGNNVDIDNSILNSSESSDLTTVRQGRQARTG